MASSSNMYAVLQETNGKEYESWLYFIRYTGNEEALQHLHDQIETVDWYILDDLSTFDLDLDNLVSESTASDMIRLNLNHVSNHRKFDGKMEKIDLGLKESYSNDKKIVKVFKKIGIGHIDEFIEDEDVFIHDMGSDDESDDGSSGTEYEYDISESSSSGESDDEDEKKPSSKKGSTIDKLKEEIKLRKELKERERIEREREIERKKEADKKREKERKEKERKEKEKKRR